MDVQEQLQTYVQQLVALGQTALALRRRGEWLPVELALPAEALLTLERAWGETPTAAAPDAPALATDAPDDEPDAPPFTLLPLEPDAVSPTSGASDDLAPVFAGPTAGPADDWLRPLAGATPAAGATPEPLTGLVLNLDAEPGDDLAEIDLPLAVLPPLVIDPDRDLLPEDDAPILPDPTNAEPPARLRDLAAEEPATPAAATDELQYCVNCGGQLRPGRRFCHRCGTPVSADARPASPAAQPPPALQALAFQPAPNAPLSELPTFAGVATFTDTEANPLDEGARFCNNCGMSIAQGIAVCPECGSRDIG